MRQQYGMVYRSLLYWRCAGVDCVLGDEVSAREVRVFMWVNPGR